MSLNQASVARRLIDSKTLCHILRYFITMLQQFRVLQASKVC